MEDKTDNSAKKDQKESLENPAPKNKKLVLWIVVVTIALLFAVFQISSCNSMKDREKEVNQGVAKINTRVDALDAALKASKQELEATEKALLDSIEAIKNSPPPEWWIYVDTNSAKQEGEPK